MTITSDFPELDICFEASCGHVAEEHGEFWSGNGGAAVIRPETVFDSSSDIENVYKVARHYKVSGDSLKKRISKCDDSEAIGEYHTIDLNDWEEVEWRVSDKKRIGVGRPYGGKETVIFMQVGMEGKTDKCKKYRMFYKKDFVELRQSRGENKYKRMKVYRDGTVWVGESNIDRNFIVFVRKDEVK